MAGEIAVLIWIIRLNTKSWYVSWDMETITRTCDKCRKRTPQLLRYYMKKTRYFGLITNSGDKHVTMICWGCKLEREIDPWYANKMVHDYDLRMKSWEADKLFDMGNVKKAEQKMRNALKDDPRHFFCLVLLAKCRMAAGDRAGAEEIVDRIKEVHLDKDIRDVLEEVFERGSPDGGAGGAWEEEFGEDSSGGDTEDVWEEAFGKGSPGRDAEDTEEDTSGNDPPDIKSERDPYKVLGVPRTASQDVIKRKYRSMILKYHPDRNDSKDAASILMRVTESYEVLSDPKSRHEFDMRNRSWRAPV